MNQFKTWLVPDFSWHWFLGDESNRSSESVPPQAEGEGSVQTALCGTCGAQKRGNQTCASLRLWKHPSNPGFQNWRRYISTCFGESFGSRRGEFETLLGTRFQGCRRLVEPVARGGVGESRVGCKGH